MKKLTTDQALKEVLYRDGINSIHGVNYNTLKTWRSRLKSGKLPEETKEMILQKAGFKVVQEKLWTCAPGK